jgi:hypothetical protein
MNPFPRASGFLIDPRNRLQNGEPDANHDGDEKSGLNQNPLSTRREGLAVDKFCRNRTLDGKGDAFPSRLICLTSARLTAEANRVEDSEKNTLSLPPMISVALISPRKTPRATSDFRIPLFMRRSYRRPAAPGNPEN